MTHILIFLNSHTSIEVILGFFFSEGPTFSGSLSLFSLADLDEPRNSTEKKQVLLNIFLNYISLYFGILDNSAYAQ